MLTLLRDMRKAALIAAIAMAVAVLWGLLGLVAITYARPTPDTNAAVTFGLVTLISAAPLFVLLLLLSRKTNGVVLSPGQIYLMRAMVCLAVAKAIMEILNWTHPRNGLNLSRLWTEDFWRWFRNSPIMHGISGVVQLLSTLIFLLFMIALARQAPSVSRGEDRPTRIIRGFALATVVIHGLIAVLAALLGFHSRYLSGRQTVQLELSELLDTLVPWIIFTARRGNSAYQAPLREQSIAGAHYDADAGSSVA